MARKSKKESKLSASAEKVVKDYQASWDYTSSNYHNRWEDAFKLYNNERVKVAYHGISDAFVPMTFSTVEMMVAALFGSKPKFEFTPPAEKQDQKTDILNALLDYYWEKDKWSIKVIKWGRGMIREGTSVVYVYWDHDHPCIKNVPIRDFFIDPYATDFQDARYMGRRYLTTLDELKSFEIVDPETGEMVPKYKNLNQVTPGYDPSDQTAKQQRDMFMGSTASDDNEEQVEVIEYWTRDQVFSVANRSTVIEEVDNYYKPKTDDNSYSEGFYPFASLRNYTDESLFYARGEVDVIKDEQELLNDNKNQKNDALSYILNQMYTLDPKYAHLLNEIENIPGATYLAEAGALTPIPQRSVPPEAFTEELNIKNEIREATASNEVIKGVGQDQSTTATEVNAQVAGAGQRLALKVTQIEDEGFHDLAKIILEMVKLYVTEPMMVRVIGKDGAKWEEFDPSDYDGEYEPRVQLQITMENQRAEEANNGKELLGAFLGDPDLNQMELKKMVLSKSFGLEPDEVEQLFAQPDIPEELPAEMPMEAMPPMDGGMPIDPNMMPPELMAPMPEMPQEPSAEVFVDPVTGELVPVPTEEELIAMGLTA